MRLEINPQHPEPRKIQRALEVLRDGGVIAYPTDTVYGIGCDITQKRAIDRVYAIKRMKPEQPLAFICPDLGDLSKYALVDDRTYRLMRRLTPGPYCFILEASREVPRILQMKRKTVGIRVPHNEVALALLRALGNPIVSSTASRDGEPLNDPADIAEAFPGLDLILDAGFGGLIPSTVLDVTGPEIVVVREGAGSVDAL
ncbi:MAG: L-threonylcarbamoyladenylate synthase [Deltaproteobacteria bacterium]|jgi:tRNA threonylcarbamoyl adenosine modification protein (Sua5/YciO/YrdC/YwlC family)